MSSQNPTPSADQPVPDEALVHLGKVVAEVLASNKAFISNVVSLAVEASVKSVADSTQRQRQELETYAASLTQGNSAVAPGGAVATATEKRVPKTNDEWRDAMLLGIYQFIQNPVDNITKVVDVVQKVRRPALDASMFKTATLAQVRAMAEAQPDMYDYVHGLVFPNPVLALMTEQLPKAGFEGFQQGLKQKILQETLKEMIRTNPGWLSSTRDASDSILGTSPERSSGTPKKPLLETQRVPQPKPEEKPAAPLAVTAQNLKPSDWKLRL